jgi:hypothetical protein
MVNFVLPALRWEMVSPSFLQDDQHKLQREFFTQQYSFDGF